MAGGVKSFGTGRPGVFSHRRHGSWSTPGRFALRLLAHCRAPGGFTSPSALDPIAELAEEYRAFTPGAANAPRPASMPSFTPCSPKKSSNSSRPSS